MKIVVLNTSVPFLRGGAEHLADNLVAELRSRGHLTEHVKVPLRWNSPLAISQSMFAAATLMMPEAELVIPLKFPAYLVPHQNKVPWLLHQFRQVYELWGTPYQDVPDTADGRALKESIKSADDHAFRQSRRIFTNSAVTRDRLKKYNGFDSSVLHAPLGDPESFRSGEHGDYLLAIGRVSGGKRQALLAEAMAHSRSSLTLVIAGSPETPGELVKIQEVIARHDLQDRIELIPRFITDAEKVDLIAGARAVAYLPVDEDSYGYVTAEAMLAERPVLSTSDAGGVLELVRDGESGHVAEPTPESLAEKIDLLAASPDRARGMGRAGRRLVEEMNLSWDNVIERLTS